MLKPFDTVTIEDNDENIVTVNVDSDAEWRRAVMVTTGANRTFDHTLSPLTPAAARRLAAALETAADEAELQQLEQDDDNNPEDQARALRSLQHRLTVKLNRAKLIGRPVLRADDDSDSPVYGTIIDVATPDGMPEWVWVVWGNDPNTLATRVATDELVPAVSRRGSLL